jgi:DHA1 family multidrug resistance protein-like MFS transporter
MSIGKILGPTLGGVLYDVNMVYPFVLGFILLVLTTMTNVVWAKRNLKQPKLVGSEKV